MSDIARLQQLLKEYDEEKERGGPRIEEILLKIYQLEISEYQSCLEHFEFTINDDHAPTLIKLDKVLSTGEVQFDEHIDDPHKMVAIYKCLFASVLNDKNYLSNIEDFSKLLDQKVKIFHKDKTLDKTATNKLKFGFLKDFISSKGSGKFQEINKFIKAKGANFTKKEAEELHSQNMKNAEPEEIKDFFVDRLVKKLRKIGWYSDDPKDADLKKDRFLSQDEITNFKFKLLGENQIRDELQAAEPRFFNINDKEALFKAYEKKAEEIYQEQARCKLFYIKFLMKYEKFILDKKEIEEKLQREKGEILKEKGTLLLNLSQEEKQEQERIAEETGKELEKESSSGDSGDSSKKNFEILQRLSGQKKSSTRVQPQIVKRNFESERKNIESDSEKKLDLLNKKNAKDQYDLTKELNKFLKDFRPKEKELNSFFADSDDLEIDFDMIAKSALDINLSTAELRSDFYRTQIDTTRSHGGNSVSELDEFASIGDFYPIESSIEYSTELRSANPETTYRILEDDSVIEEVVPDNLKAKYDRDHHIFEQCESYYVSNQRYPKDLLQFQYQKFLENATKENPQKPNLKIPPDDWELDPEYKKVHSAFIPEILEELIASEKFLAIGKIEFDLHNRANPSYGLELFQQRINDPANSLSLNLKKCQIDEVVINCDDYFLFDFQPYQHKSDDEFIDRLKKVIEVFDQIGVKTLRLNIGYSDGKNFDEILTKVLNKNNYSIKVIYHQNYQIDEEKYQNEEKRSKKSLAKKCSSQVKDQEISQNLDFGAVASSKKERKGYKYLTNPNIESKTNQDQNEELEQEQQIDIDQDQNQDKVDPIDKSKEFDDDDLISRSDIHSKFSSFPGLYPGLAESKLQELWDEITAFDSNFIGSDFSKKEFRIDKMTSQAALYLFYYKIQNRFVGSLNLRHLPQGFYLAQNATDGKIILDFDIRRKTSDKDFIIDFAGLDKFQEFDAVFDDVAFFSYPEVKQALGINIAGYTASFFGGDRGEDKFKRLFKENNNYKKSFYRLCTRFSSDVASKLINKLNLIQTKLDQGSKKSYSNFVDLILEPFFNDDRYVDFLVDANVLKRLGNLANLDKSEIDLFLHLISNMKIDGKNPDVNPILLIDDFMLFRKRLKTVHKINLKNIAQDKDVIGNLNISSGEDLRAICYRATEILRYASSRDVCFGVKKLYGPDYKKAILKQMFTGKISLRERGMYHALFCDNLVEIDQGLGITDNPGFGLDNLFNLDKKTFNVSEKSFLNSLSRDIRSGNSGNNVDDQQFQLTCARYLRFIASYDPTKVNDFKVSYDNASYFIDDLSVRDLGLNNLSKYKILSLFNDFKSQNYKQGLIEIFKDFNDPKLDYFLQSVSCLKPLRPSFEDIVNLAKIYQRECVHYKQDECVEFRESLDKIYAIRPKWSYFSRAIYNLTFHDAGSNYRFCEICQELEKIRGDRVDEVDEYQRIFVAATLLNKKGNDLERFVSKRNLYQLSFISDANYGDDISELSKKQPKLLKKDKLVALEDFPREYKEDKLTADKDRIFEYETLKDVSYKYFSLDYIKSEFARQEYLRVVDQYYDFDLVYRYNNSPPLHYNFNENLVLERINDDDENSNLYLRFLNNFDVFFRIDFIRTFVGDRRIDAVEERNLRDNVERNMRIFFRNMLGFEFTQKDSSVIKENIAVSSRNELYAKSFVVFQRLYNNFPKESGLMIKQFANLKGEFADFLKTDDNKLLFLDCLDEFIKLSGKDFSPKVFNKYLQIRFSGVVGPLKSIEDPEFKNLKSILANDQLESDDKIKLLDICILDNKKLGPASKIITNISSSFISQRDKKQILNKSLLYNYSYFDDAVAFEDALKEFGSIYAFDSFQLVRSLSETYDGDISDVINLEDVGKFTDIVDSITSNGYGLDNNVRINRKKFVNFNIDHGGIDRSVYLEYSIFEDFLIKHVNSDVAPDKLVTLEQFKDIVTESYDIKDKKFVYYISDGCEYLFPVSDLSQNAKEREKQLSDLKKLNSNAFTKSDNTLLKDVVKHLSSLQNLNQGAGVDPDPDLDSTSIGFLINQCFGKIENVYLNLTDQLDNLSYLRDRYHELFAQILKFDGNNALLFFEKFNDIMDSLLHKVIEGKHLESNAENFKFQLAFLRLNKLAESCKVESEEEIKELFRIEELNHKFFDLIIEKIDFHNEQCAKEGKHPTDFSLLVKNAKKLFFGKNIIAKSLHAKLKEYGNIETHINDLLQKIKNVDEEYSGDIEEYDKKLADTVNNSFLTKIFVELDKNPDLKRNKAQQFDDSMLDLSKFLDVLVGSSNDVDIKMPQAIADLDSYKELFADMSYDSLSLVILDNNITNDASKIYLLAALREAYFRVNHKYPYTTQMIPLLYFVLSPGQKVDDKNLSKMMAEISTGQGKSLISSIYSAYQAKVGKAVHVTSATEILSERDFKENQDFYEYLGIKSHYINSNGINPNGSDNDADYKTGRIYHSTPSSFYFYLSKERLSGQSQDFDDSLDKVKISDRVWLSDETDTLLDNKTLWRLSVSGGGGEELRELYIYVNRFYDENFAKIDDVVHKLQNSKISASQKKKLDGDLYKIIEEFKDRLQENYPDIYNIFEKRICFNDSEILDDKIMLLLSSAGVAKGFKQGVDYLIEQTLVDGITYNVARILKKPSNEPDRSSTWGDGVQQILHVRLEDEKAIGRFLLDKENIAITSGTPKQLIQYCGGFVGITGTMGQIEDLKLLSQQFGIGHAIKVQPHQILQRQDLGAFLVRDRDIEDLYARDEGLSRSEQETVSLPFSNKQIELLTNILAGTDKLRSSNKNGVNRNRIDSQPTLIICETLKDVEILKTRLVEKFKGEIRGKKLDYLTPQIQIITGEESEDEIERKLKKAGQKGVITIATPLFGRGTDIKISGAAKKEGLYTILMSVFNDRETGQVEGRSGRNGQPGKTVSLINASGKKLRNLLKEIDLEKGLNNQQRVEKLRDRLFAKNRENLKKQVAESVLIEEYFRRFAYIKKYLIDYVEENKTEELEDEDDLNLEEEFSRRFANFLNDDVSLILKDFASKKGKFDQKKFNDQVSRIVEHRFDSFLKSNIYPLIKIKCDNSHNIIEESKKFAKGVQGFVDDQLARLDRQIESSSITAHKFNHNRSRYSNYDRIYGITGLYLRKRDPVSSVDPKKEITRSISIARNKKDYEERTFDYEVLDRKGNYNIGQASLVHYGIMLDNGYEKVGFEGDSAEKPTNFRDHKVLESHEKNIFKKGDQEVVLFRMMKESYAIEYLNNNDFPQKKYIIPICDDEGKNVKILMIDSSNEKSFSQQLRDQVELDASSRITNVNNAFGLFCQKYEKFCDIIKPFEHEKLSDLQLQNLFIKIYLENISKANFFHDSNKELDSQLFSYFNVENLKLDRLVADNLNYKKALFSLLSQQEDLTQGTEIYSSGSGREVVNAAAALSVEPVDDDDRRAFVDSSSTKSKPLQKARNRLGFLPRRKAVYSEHSEDDLDEYYVDPRFYASQIQQDLQNISKFIRFKHVTQDCYEIFLDPTLGSSFLRDRKNFKLIHSIAYSFGCDVQESLKNGKLVGYNFILSGNTKIKKDQLEITTDAYRLMDKLKEYNNRKNFKEKLQASIDLLTRSKTKKLKYRSEEQELPIFKESDVNNLTKPLKDLVFSRYVGLYQKEFRSKYNIKRSGLIKSKLQNQGDLREALAGKMNGYVASRKSTLPTIFEAEEESDEESREFREKKDKRFREFDDSIRRKIEDGSTQDFKAEDIASFKLYANAKIEECRKLLGSTLDSFDGFSNDISKDNVVQKNRELQQLIELSNIVIKIYDLLKIFDIEPKDVNIDVSLGEEYLRTLWSKIRYSEEDFRGLEFDIAKRRIEEQNRIIALQNEAIAKYNNIKKLWYYKDLGTDFVELKSLKKLQEILPETTQEERKKIEGSNAVILQENNNLSKFNNSIRDNQTKITELSDKNTISRNEILDLGIEFKKATLKFDIANYNILVRNYNNNIVKYQPHIFGRNREEDKKLQTLPNPCSLKQKEKIFYDNLDKVSLNELFDEEPVLFDFSKFDIIKDTILDDEFIAAKQGIKDDIIDSIKDANKVRNPSLVNLGIDVDGHKENLDHIDNIAEFRDILYSFYDKIDEFSAQNIHSEVVEQIRQIFLNIEDDHVGDISSYAKGFDIFYSNLESVKEGCTKPRIAEILDNNKIKELLDEINAKLEEKKKLVKADEDKINNKIDELDNKLSVLTLNTSNSSELSVIKKIIGDKDTENFSFFDISKIPTSRAFSEIKRGLIELRKLYHGFKKSFSAEANVKTRNGLIERLEQKIIQFQNTENQFIATLDSYKTAIASIDAKNFNSLLLYDLRNEWLELSKNINQGKLTDAKTNINNLKNLKDKDGSDLTDLNTQGQLLKDQLIDAVKLLDHPDIVKKIQEVNSAVQIKFNSIKDIEDRIRKNFDILEAAEIDFSINPQNIENKTKYVEFLAQIFNKDPLEISEAEYNERTKLSSKSTLDNSDADKAIKELFDDIKLYPHLAQKIIVVRVRDADDIDVKIKEVGKKFTDLESELKFFTKLKEVVRKCQKFLHPEYEKEFGIGSFQELSDYFANINEILTKPDFLKEPEFLDNSDVTNLIADLKKEYDSGSIKPIIDNSENVKKLLEDFSKKLQEKETSQQQKKADFSKRVEDLVTIIEDDKKITDHNFKDFVDQIIETLEKIYDGDVIDSNLIPKVEKITGIKEFDESIKTLFKNYQDYPKLFDDVDIKENIDKIIDSLRSRKDNLKKPKTPKPSLAPIAITPLSGPVNERDIFEKIGAIEPTLEEITTNSIDLSLNDSSVNTLKTICPGATSLQIIFEKEKDPDQMRQFFLNLQPKDYKQIKLIRTNNGFINPKEFVGNLSQAIPRSVGSSRSF